MARTRALSKRDRQLMRERRAWLRMVFTIAEEREWSLRQIADHAELSVGTVYHCWDLCFTPGMTRDHWEGRASTVQKLGEATGLMLTMDDKGRPVLRAVG